MSSQTSGRPVEILLVDDNPGDLRLTKEILKDRNVCNNLRVVGDGAEAMAFLRREGSYTNAPRPDLILLDLNLPKKDGPAVLEEIRSDCLLRRIPVVILSTSEAEEDIKKSYDLQATCYITKPVDLDQFIRVVEFIENSWLIPRN